MFGIHVYTLLLCELRGPTGKDTTVVTFIASAPSPPPSYPRPAPILFCSARKWTSTKTKTPNNNNNKWNNFTLTGVCPMTQPKESQKIKAEIILATKQDWIIPSYSLGVAPVQISCPNAIINIGVGTWWDVTGSWGQVSHERFSTMLLVLSSR